MHWATRVVIEEILEFILVGARLADPKLRESYGNDLFSGDLLNVVTTAPAKQASELWALMKRYGVERVADEKLLDAVARTLRDKVERRKCVTEISEVLNSWTQKDITRRQLMELRDKLYGRDELVPEPDITGLADPMANIATG